MKHKADQYELFPDTSKQPPIVGELVKVLSWDRGKPRPGPRQWRVISWPLYFLLSGEDPDGWQDEHGDWDKRPPDQDEVPILAQSLPPANRWTAKVQNPFLPWDCLRLEIPASVTRGY